MTSLADISALPAPKVLEALDYEAILSRQVAKFRELWAAVRARQPDAELPQYDVELIETDPALITMEALAYVEAIVRNRINAAIKALLPAYAKGTDLQAITSRVGVIRATRENDLQLLERYLLKLARPSAGSHLGYLGRVLEAWPDRGDVAVLGPANHGRRGDIDIILAAPEGATVSGSIITSVQSALTARDAKPLTDVVATRAAGKVSYAIRQRITVAEDRNAGPILAAAKAAANAFVTARYAIGVPIKRSAIIATSYVPGVIAVEDLTNGSDVAVAADAVAWCAPADIVVQVAS